MQKGPRAPFLLPNPLRYSLPGELLSNQLWQPDIRRLRRDKHSRFPVLS